MTFGSVFTVRRGESLTDRFCRLDQERFGDIKDITDKGYYQNSFHYDVRKDVTPLKS